MKTRLIASRIKSLRNLILLPLLCLASTFTYSASPSLLGNDIKKACRQLKLIPGKAYLVDSSGIISEGPISLGTVMIPGTASNEEYYKIPLRYRVVISSPQFAAESRQELLAKKIKPACSGTSEFTLTAKINTLKSRPGEIGSSFDIDLERFFYDSKTYYPIPPEYKFNFTFTGTLISPEPQMVETSVSNSEIDALMIGDARRLSLTLKNIGNAPLNITDLVDLATLSSRRTDPNHIKKARANCADSSEDGREICTLQIQKKNDDCIGRLLPSGGTCNIHLEKISEAPLPIGAVYVLKIKSNYLLGYNPRIEFKINANREVTGGLKLR